MLRKFMVLRAPDANTDGDSSTQSDANGVDSSTTEQDATAAPEGEAQGDDNESSNDATGEDGDQTNAQPTEEEVDDTPPPIADKAGDEKLPFHKEPRFQEVIKEKREAVERASQLEPFAQRAQILDNYLSSNGISSNEFTDMLETLRLMKSDPGAAWTKIKPTVEALQMYNGERLPQDLEAQVAAGMDPTTAKELARLRISERRNQAQAQNATQTQYQYHEQMINNTFSVWDQSRRATDPDFKPKADPTAPDGKWEICNAKLIAMRQVTPPRSQQEAQSLVERAYKETNTLFASMVRKPLVRKQIGSRQNSSNSSPVMKTAQDVARAIMSGKKPHELKYS